MAGKKTQKISFAAINPYKERDSITATETRGSNGLISWGNRNDYPQYLKRLYRSVPILSACINGSVDYTVGDDVESGRTLQGDRMNEKGDSIRDIVELLAKDYFLFGGFSIEVIRSQSGDVAGIYYMPLECLRVDSSGESFTFRKKWPSSNGEPKVYPRFIQGGTAPSSIYYVSNERTRYYPTPLYEAAVVPCEIQKDINTFHHTALGNGFMGGLMVNFNNNSLVDEEQQQDIERRFTEKFTGFFNGLRTIFSWNSDKEHATTAEPIQMEDFGEKFSTLDSRSEKQIFTCFRANPNLFGIPTKDNGFNSEEYTSTFRLFNKTVIQPAQRRIIDALNDILGGDFVTITPFNIEEGSQKVE